MTAFRYAWQSYFRAHLLPRLFTVALAGAASALAMAPFNWIVVLFAGLSLLYGLLTQATTKWQAFLTGWHFGLGYHVAGLYWIANALLVEGNPYSWAWPLAAIGLPAALAVYFGLATLLAWRLSKLKTPSGFIVFILALFAGEYLRGHLLTGFPWNLFGYGWGGFWPLAQPVHLIGIYGLSLLTIFWCALPGFIFLGNASRLSKSLIGGFAFLLFCLSWAYGAERLAGSRQDGAVSNTTSFVIVQPNIAQHNKWRRDKIRENFQRHLTPSYYDESADIMSDATTFIVWPETALAYYHLRNNDIRDKLSNMLQSYPGRAYLISGALLQPTDNDGYKKRYANAIIVMNNSGQIIHRYKKSHLVPFGEYIPFKDFIPFQPVARFNNMIAGKKPTPLRIGNNHTFFPLICYEVIFPGLLDNGAQQTNLLINVTNDAWYGHSAGPYQHFMKARFRAVENDRPLVRAANTGISAVIDSRGRIKAQTDIFVKNKIHLKLH